MLNGEEGEKSELPFGWAQGLREARGPGGEIRGRWKGKISQLWALRQFLRQRKLRPTALGL